MRKYLFAISLGLIMHNLTSQNRWNFVVGTTFSSFDTDLMAPYGFEFFRSEYIAGGGSASSEAKNSLKVGGFWAVEHAFMTSKSGFVLTGFRYVTLGDNYAFETSDIKYQNGYGGELDGKFIWRPRLDYIAVPLNYGFYASELISFYGGFTPHLNVRNIVRTNRFTGPANDLEEKWDAQDSPINTKKILLFANAGISYYAKSGVTFFDLRVSKSLGSVYDDSQVAAIFNETGAWNVELGIGMTIWKKSKKFSDQE